MHPPPVDERDEAPDRSERVPDGEGMLSQRERRALVLAIAIAMAIATVVGAIRGG
jgi:hypothetical protein